MLDIAESCTDYGLRSTSNQELHLKLKSLVKEETRITLVVIKCLREVERRMLYAEYGYTSLIEYCIKEFGYSEGSAYRRVAAMRVIKDVPEITAKIRTGALNLTNISKAQTYFKASKVSVEAKREVLEKLEHQSTRSAERTLLELQPDKTISFRPEERQITSMHTKVEMVFTEEELSEIRKLKALMSHVGNVSHKDLYLDLVRRVTKQKDPEQKRVATPAQKLENQDCVVAPVLMKEVNISSSKPKTINRYIPSCYRQEVYMRSKGSCTYVDPNTKRRCGSKLFLQIEHRLPLAHGGKTELSNLTLLCRTHNLFSAVQVLGAKKMENYIPSIKC